MEGRSHGDRTILKKAFKMKYIVKMKSCEEQNSSWGTKFENG